MTLQRLPACAIFRLSMKKFLVFTTFFIALFAGATASIYAQSKSVTIISEASIKPALELAISKSGASELQFGNIVSSGTPTETAPLTILIDIYSNTGQRYQLTELINGPLQNANGDQIGLQNLKFTTSSAKSTGTAVSTATTASSAPQTIFTSDTDGTSELVSAQYVLTPPALQAPGDYSTVLTYTVSAI